MFIDIQGEDDSLLFFYLTFYKKYDIIYIENKKGRIIMNQKAVVIIFKQKDTDGDHEDISLTDMEHKVARKVYKKLIHQWKHNKVVNIPGHMIVVASDAIFSIIMKG